MEPGWRRLRYVYGDQVRWQYRMGGLVADAERFEDPVNSVHRPAQWAPQWFEVHKKTGMPLDEKLWLDQPPDSSYPACVAIKAIQRQDPDLAERCLRRLREAAMVRGIDIARREHLEQIVGRVEGVDFSEFRRDFEGAAREDFREDLRDVRYRELGRFPALLFETGEQRRAGEGGSEKLLTVGWRPFDVLCEAVEQIAPGVEPVRETGDPVEMLEAWGRAAAPEVATMSGVGLEQVRERLEGAVAEGRIERRETTADEPLYAVREAG